MKPLLNIQTVSIELDYKVTRAALRAASNPPPRANVTRQRGDADIRRTNGRLNINTTEGKASMGLKTPTRLASDFARQGRSDALTATRNNAEAGTKILDSHGKGSPIVDIAMAQLNRTREHVLSFIPSVAPQIEYVQGSLSFNFSMDKLHYDWSLNRRAQLEYVPGSIEISVTQYPDIIIEYLGGPIYVPRSADPNYIPPPSIDTTA